MHSWGVESTARCVGRLLWRPSSPGSRIPYPGSSRALSAAGCLPTGPAAGQGTFCGLERKPLVLAQKGQKQQGTEGILEITRIARVIHTRGWICLGREEVKRTLGTECGLESQQVPRVALETQYVVVCAHLMPTLDMADGCPFWVCPLHPSAWSGGNLPRVHGSSLRPQAHRVQQPPRAA